ncbi:hypothetical protein ACRAWC_23300 [Leifsonia sp. L25]|uniref:hypothetical protein n=1 Tax=Leifsonia sp. L25 TaxID=3423957 RepID=UPI003D696F54
MTRRDTKFGRIALTATAGLVALILAGCTSSAGSADLPSQQPGGFPKDVEKRLSTAITDAMTLTDASAGFAGVWAPGRAAGPPRRARRPAAGRPRCRRT